MNNNINTPRWILTYGSILVSIFGVVSVLGVLVLILINLINNKNSNIDLVIGIVLVFGVSVLLLFLFLMSLGFNAVGLTDKGEPLGLPTGSIRALIALLLIFIWVIVSIFIFNAISNLDATKYADAIKLGQQFYTTMSTLVVAIAAFYFGSNTHRDAQSDQSNSNQSPDSGPASAQPVITHINPNSGKQGQAEIPLTIMGKNFGTPKAVRLTLDKETPITGKDISFSQKDLSIIGCTISLAGEHPPKVGHWDVVVVNHDDKEYQLPKAFEVKAPPASPTI